MRDGVPGAPPPPPPEVRTRPRAGRLGRLGGGGRSWIVVLDPEQRYGHTGPGGKLQAARVLGIGDEVAVRGQGLEQLSLGGGDRLDRAEPLQVHRSDRGDHANLGVH